MPHTAQTVSPTARWLWFAQLSRFHAMSLYVINLASCRALHKITDAITDAVTDVFIITAITANITAITANR
jgi:hypothetical protein